MAISTNYPSPIWVNGYACRNCGDVSLAQKNIDPAKPDAGPFGANQDKKTAAVEKLQKHFDAKAADDLKALEEAHRRATQQIQPSFAAALGTQPLESGSIVNLSA